MHLLGIPTVGTHENHKYLNYSVVQIVLLIMALS